MIKPKPLKKKKNLRRSVLSSSRNTQKNS